MIDVVFSTGVKGNLQMAFGRDVEIACFPLIWNVGELDEVGRPERRKSVLLQMGSRTEAAEHIQKVVREAEEKLCFLQKRAAEGESLRIWCSDAAEDVCGLYWLLERLAGCDIDITVVRLPEYIEEERDAVIQYQGWQEVEPAFLKEFALQGKKLPKALQQAMVLEWMEHKKENAILRVILQGNIVSVPEDFYDPFILQEIKKLPEEFAEGKLAAAVLSKHLGILDGWLALRIEYFIQQGILEIAADGAVFRRKIRKCKKTSL